ncbi:hypothetical protein [Aeromonas sp. 102P]|uniref:hypothetical protein n=1 Tax=Aeromonas sp. 102P TaxID=3452711 RepID=UPI003F7919A2
MNTPYLLTLDPLAIVLPAPKDYTPPTHPNVILEVDDWFGLAKVHIYQVAGVVTVRDIGRAREVLVLSAEPIDGQYRVLAEVTSGGDGAFTAQWQTYSGKVLVVGISLFGEPFQPQRIYQVGEVLSPSEWTGFVYVCEQPGTVGAQEPVWPQAEDAAVQVGTAVFRTRQYLPIVAHGPLQPAIEVS